MSQNDFVDAWHPYNSIDQPGVEDRTCICPARSRGHQRCRNVINRSDLAEARLLRVEIATLSSTSDKLDALKRYASLRCCKGLHRKMLDPELLSEVARNWLRELNVTIPGDSSPPPPPPPSPAPPSTASPQTNIGANHNQACAPQRQPPVVHRYSTRSTGSTLDPPSSVTYPMSAETSALEFEQYVSSPSQTVPSLLMRPLTRRDRLPGHIYLYTRESSPGFAKIGLTTASVSERLTDWQAKCRYRPILRHKICNVPNVYRVETLIHFQLAKHRRWERWCNGCSSRHKEWFEIEIDTAIQVMNEWAQWMDAAQPFDDQGCLKTDWWMVLNDLKGHKVSEVTAEILLDSLVSDPIEENDDGNHNVDEAEIAPPPVTTPATPRAPAPAQPQNQAHDSTAVSAAVQALRALSPRDIEYLRQVLQLLQTAPPASEVPVSTPSPSPSLPRHDLLAPRRALTVAG